jgi:hypothetical protein
VDPVPDPILLRNSGSAGNRTLTSGSVARNSDHQTTESVNLTFHSKNLIGLRVSENKALGRIFQPKRDIPQGS